MEFMPHELWDVVRICYACLNENKDIDLYKVFEDIKKLDPEPSRLVEEFCNGVNIKT